jgi:hypothetical protein
MKDEKKTSGSLSSLGNFKKIIYISSKSRGLVGLVVVVIVSANGAEDREFESRMGVGLLGHKT